MSINEIQERHDADNSNRYQYYLDCGELLTMVESLQSKLAEANAEIFRLLQWCIPLDES